MPYEISKKYEEEIIGEFENSIEKGYFHKFISFLDGESIILDLACGDGRHTLKLSEHFKHVVAVDLSYNQLKLAKRKCLRRENISFIRASMFNLPFSQNIFDGIWFSQAFEYIPPDMRKLFISSIYNILKPRGTLYMSVETWMYPNLLDTLRRFLGDLELFLYWKFIRRKPLIWGEFLYRISIENVSIPHYHVHIDKWTLCKILDKNGFYVEEIDLYDGYIYVLCRKS